MMSDKDHIDRLINKYAKGKLEGHELQAFEKMLSEDAELGRKVEVVKVTNQLVILNRLREVNTVLKAETATVKERDSGNSNKGKIILGVSILTVLISTVFFVSKNKKEPGSAPIKNKEHKIVHKSESTDLAFNEKKETSVNEDQKPKTTSSENTQGDQGELGLPSYRLSLPDTSKRKAHHATDSSARKTDEPERKTVNTNPNQADKKVSSCKSDRITADVKTEDPCRGEQNGKILLTTVKGGTEPYTYILNGTGENSQGQFTDLAAGNYQIKITDMNGCHMIMNNLTLSEKLCRKDLEFSPFRGEELQLPVYEKSGNLSIFDKTGKLYHQQSIASGEKFVWNGLSSSGELIVGYYVFVIQYEDGAAQKGSITIAP